MRAKSYHGCESIPSVWSHEVDSCGLSNRRGPETKLKSIEQNLLKRGVMNRHLLRAWFPCGDTESLPCMKLKQTRRRRGVRRK